MIILAIIPSIILFFIVWKYDTIEKEPIGLLMKLIGAGALTLVSAEVIGLLGEKLLKFILKDSSSLLYIFIFSFVLIGLVEELGKFVVLKLITWKNKEFNYTFDAIVYAAMVSLGFATVENIIYVILHGSGASLFRVIFSVPGHMIYAVFMGYFYGLARLHKSEGNDGKAMISLISALVVPTAIHGFYQLCLNTKKPVYIVLFVIYEILVALVCVKQFLKLSKEDKEIPEMEFNFSEEAWEGGADEGKM